MAERADLVVIGGGLSGLSLAMRLALSGYAGAVRIVEPRQTYLDDRSWAFWTRPGGPWSAVATRTWDRWRFSRRDGTCVSRGAAGWCYAYVRSIDFYQAALRAIAASPNIRLLRGTRAGKVEVLGGCATVATSAGTLSAPRVVDTRPPSAGRWSAATMFQSFAGRELALRQPGFDPLEVELMTDMRCDSRGFVFTYILPLSPIRALVEVTRFSSRPLDGAGLEPDLDALLAARGWTGAEVLRKESAVLPMGLPVPDDACALPGVVCAGTGAGALRAATGYGFLRIQGWAERCADALMQGRPPVGHPAEPRLQRWLDGLFLQALARQPERAPELFWRLAASVPGPAFVRFMSDQAGWADLARVIAALPPGPFLQALRARRLHTRLPA